MIGLAGIIAGTLIRVKYEDYEVLVSKNIGGVSILLIALGGIIFIVAFFGCCGAIKKNVIMLTIVCIVTVMTMEVTVPKILYQFICSHEPIHLFSYLKI